VLSAPAAHSEVQVSIVKRSIPRTPRADVQAGIARMKRFEREKAAWIKSHPGATPDELRRAADEIAARLTPGG
jgi:hypothetical protein